MPVEWRQVAIAPGQMRRVRLAPIERQTVLSDTVTVVSSARGEFNIPKAAWDAAALKGR